MKNYSINEIVYIDSQSLIFMIENHNLYTINTIVITFAELERRNLISADLREKLKVFCSNNKIMDLHKSFEYIIKEKGIRYDEWVEMGKNNSPIIVPRKLNISKDSIESSPEINWKESRNGILIFCLFHFIFEIAIGNATAVGAPVFFNYFISRWYINRQIEKGIKQDSFLLYGITIAGIVFIIRLILGFIFFSLILGRLKG
jgi:hypothetical protein